MNKHKVETELRSAFTKATPDVLSAVLSACEQEKGTVIHMTKTSKTSVWVRRAASLAAALVVVFGGAFGVVAYRANHAVASVISLDVNPSIELQINKNDKVLDVIARNEAGATVIGDLDFSGSSTDVAIHAIIDSMLKNGYLDELANSILISVNSNDPGKGAELRVHLSDVVASALQNGALEGAVLSQTVTGDASLQEIADAYGISAGKAQMISNLTAQNTHYSLEALAALSVNELSLLLAANNTPIENGGFVGNASEKSYVGTERAAEAALTHAGVTAAEATRLRAELDFDDGTMVYEVEFYVNGVEYEYEVDAVDGTVRTRSVNDHRITVDTPETAITTSGAKAIVLAHAAVTEADARFEKVELDEEDGKAIYEIEFVANGVEYEYEVAVSDGTILRFQSERTDEGQHIAERTVISAERAREIALQYAGVSATEAVFTQTVHLHEAVYELEFTAVGIEYEVKIHAYTGAVIDFERESAERPPQTTTLPPQTTASTSAAVTTRATEPPATEPNGIDRDEALKLALERANVNAEDAKGVSVEADYDDGRKVFEVEFRVGSVEYDVTIDAESGAVLEFDREIDD